MILPNKNITVFFKTGDKGVNYLMMRGKPIRPFDNGNQIGIKKTSSSSYFDYFAGEAQDGDDRVRGADAG